MTGTTTRLLDNFKTARLSPNRVAHLYIGTVMLTWHADDDDDRFVAVTESAKGTSYLGVSRDGGRAEAVVLYLPEQVFAFVVNRLSALAPDWRPS